MVLGRALTVLLLAVTGAACASGPRRYNIYLEASAGVVGGSIDGDRALTPTIGAHLGIAKETAHSDGFNAHMGPSALALLDGATDWRALLAFLTLHLDHTTWRTDDGSRVHRWATILEGPALWLPGDEVAATAAVSVASGPTREWRASNGLLAGAGVLARGLVGGRSSYAGGVEVRFRIGLADRAPP